MKKMNTFIQNSCIPFGVSTDKYINHLRESMTSSCFIQTKPLYAIWGSVASLARCEIFTRKNSPNDKLKLEKRAFESHP